MNHESLPPRMSKDDEEQWLNDPCLALSQKWDVWICKSHAAPIARGVNRFPWGPSKPMNEQNPQESLKRYEQFILSSQEKLNELPYLYGKRFGCWCYRNATNTPCHGPTLAKLSKIAYDALMETLKTVSPDDKNSLINIRIAREEFPQVLYSFLPCDKKLMILDKPEFIASHIIHDCQGIPTSPNWKPGPIKEVISCHRITQHITTSILKSLVCSQNSQVDDDEIIKFGPHKLFPMATWIFSKSTPIINSLLNQVMDKYNRDYEILGLGSNTFSIYCCLDEESKPAGSLLADLTSTMFVEKLYSQSQTCAIITGLLFQYKNPINDVITCQKILFFSQNVYDLNWFVSGKVDEFVASLFEAELTFRN